MRTRHRDLRLLRRRRRQHARRPSTTAWACARSPIASASTRSSRRACSPGCRRRSIAALAALRTRDADDFTLGLIDAVACAADVLTFYQERLANESYLRTATERVSLQEMAKLIGYRLRPGVAAETLARVRARDAEDAAARPAARARRVRHRHSDVADARRRPEGAERARPGREAADLRDRRGDRRARPNGTRCAMAVRSRARPASARRRRWLRACGNNLKAGDALVFVGDEFLTQPDDQQQLGLPADRLGASSTPPTIART